MALWPTIRGWFARIGSDPYYASYDRSLGNIKTELDRLQVRLGPCWCFRATRFC